MRDSDRAGAVEAILFASPEPVTVKQVVEAMEGQATPAETLAILEGLQEEYERSLRGVRVERVAEGFRIVTRPSHGAFVRNFLKAQNLRKLTPASLETLAIVAYKQPVTVADVTAVRGTESSTVLKGLLEKKLIRIAGRKAVVGRPLLYSTTKDFLLHFGLNSLEDLPTFRELEDVFREEVRQESLFKEPPRAEEAPAAIPQGGEEADEPLAPEEPRLAEDAPAPEGPAAAGAGGG